jgi:hypothetical protein
VAGGGTHETVADPRRPLIYKVGLGDRQAYLNASTGDYVESVPVGPAATSVIFPRMGTLYTVAISGANQTVVVDINSHRVIRTIDLGFSPLSVRKPRR